MIQTQLLRLDPPYNIIFTTEKTFGLHIATLIVVDEATERNGKRVTTKLRTRCFPVTAPYAELDGDVWTGTELKDCYIVCRQGDTITLRTLKRFMEYCGRKDSRHMFMAIYMFLETMRDYNVNMNFTHPVSGKRITHCEVELLFDEGAEGIDDEEEDVEILTGRTIIDVRSTSSSPLYFGTYFFSEDELYDMQNAINLLAGLRGIYIRTLEPYGLKSIKFTTKDKKYQSFVDELNKRK